MTVVKRLALRGMTICATIHCPPPHTFRLFDRLLILQRGSPVYFGGNGEAALSYFYGFEKVRALILYLHTCQVHAVVCFNAKRDAQRSALRTYKEATHM